MMLLQKLTSQNEIIKHRKKFKNHKSDVPVCVLRELKLYT